MAEDIDQQSLECTYCGGQIRPESFDEKVFFCCPFGCSIIESPEGSSQDMADDDFELLLNMGLPLN